MSNMSDFGNLIKNGINLKDYNIPTFENLYPSLYEPIDIEFDQVSPDEIREYQRKSIELLQQINLNTASISDLIILVSQNNDKQDELIEVMTDILEIAKAKTKEEAENKFTQVMKKITSNIESAETLQKLLNFAMLTYNTVATNIDKISELAQHVIK